MMSYMCSSSNDRQKIERKKNTKNDTQLEIFGLDFHINTHYCFGNVIRVMCVSWVLVLENISFVGWGGDMV